MPTTAHRRAEEVDPAASEWRLYTPGFWDLLTGRVRLADGSRPAAHGRLLCRRAADGTAVYRQDPETDDEWIDRQW